MALVVFSSELQRLTGDTSVVLDVSDYRQLISALERRYPGLRAEELLKMAIAIDGDIVQDPLLESIGDNSEVHFLFRISGG